MEEEVKEPTDTDDTLIKPKEEPLDYLEISIENDENNKKYITPKGVHSDAEELNTNVDPLMLIKTEPIEDIPAQQEQDVTENIEKTPNQIVQHTMIEIKIEPLDEASGSTDFAPQDSQKPGLSTPKKCAQTQRSTTIEKSHAYTVCDSLYKSKCALVIHMRAHTIEKPYSCYICPRKFPKRSKLNNHLRIHTGEKPFSCGLCDRKFTQKWHMISHRKTHTGEQPFHCDVCKKKFNQRSHLNEHKRTHTGVKPYICELCPKKFVQKSQLTVHNMRMHTGERTSR